MGAGLRICSLLPSATEIVFALGLGERLVAVTHECDYPSEATHLPVITHSILDHGTRHSQEIHQHIASSPPRREQHLRSRPCATGTPRPDSDPDPGTLRCLRRGVRRRPAGLAPSSGSSQDPVPRTDAPPAYSARSPS